MSKEMMEALEDVKDEWLEVGIERGIAQGREEGRAQGIEQGMLNILIKQYKDNKISVEDAANYLKISANDFLKLVK